MPGSTKGSGLDASVSGRSLLGQNAKTTERDCSFHSFLKRLPKVDYFLSSFFFIQKLV